MSKMNELDACIEEIKEAADALYSVAETLTRLFSSPGEPNAPTSVTKEQVRSVLSQKSTAGHGAAVRALLKDFGASQLSDVDPAQYADLINAAAAIGTSEGAQRLERAQRSGANGTPAPVGGGAETEVRQDG